VTFQPIANHSRNHYTTPANSNKELHASSEIKHQTNLSGELTEWGNIDVSQSILQALFLVQPQQLTMSLHCRIEDSWSKMTVTWFQKSQGLTMSG